MCFKGNNAPTKELSFETSERIVKRIYIVNLQLNVAKDFCYSMTDVSNICCNYKRNGMV